MQWTGLNELREKYLSFFEGKGHLRLDSFPLVPQNDKPPADQRRHDPMKPWFMGEEEPPRHRVTHLPEVHPHRRYRERRQDRPPRHLL